MQRLKGLQLRGERIKRSIKWCEPREGESEQRVADWCRCIAVWALIGLSLDTSGDTWTCRCIDWYLILGWCRVCMCISLFPQDRCVCVCVWIKLCLTFLFDTEMKPFWLLLHQTPFVNPPSHLTALLCTFPLLCCTFLYRFCLTVLLQEVFFCVIQFSLAFVGSRLGHLAS